MKTLKLLTITAIAGILTVSTLNAQEDYDRSTDKIKHAPQHEEIKEDFRVKKDIEVRKDIKVKQDLKIKNERSQRVSQDTREHRVVTAKKAHTKKHAVKLLKRGDRGANVKVLQRALKQEGLYRGRVDGVFGKGVKRAVKKFQREHRLYADGIAGAKTLRLLHIK